MSCALWAAMEPACPVANRESSIHPFVCPSVHPSPAISTYRDNNAAHLPPSPDPVITEANPTSLHAMPMPYPRSPDHHPFANHRRRRRPTRPPPPSHHRSQYPNAPHPTAPHHTSNHRTSPPIPSPHLKPRPPKTYLPSFPTCQPVSQSGVPFRPLSFARSFVRRYGEVLWLAGTVRYGWYALVRAGKLDRYGERERVRERERGSVGQGE